MDPTIPWPVGRDDHSACVKNGTCPLLLSIGGVSNQFNTLGDLWILDIDSGRWKQVREGQTREKERKRERERERENMRDEEREGAILYS